MFHLVHCYRMQLLQTQHTAAKQHCHTTRPLPHHTTLSESCKQPEAPNVSLQHNTCPVCRKELPVDQELQQQQQQERQQRFQQEVQRQPAGLQSLFSALNPFHLFAGGPAGPPGPHTRAALAHVAARHGPAVAAEASAAAAAPADSNRMPAGTMERFEVVQTSLRELEVSSVVLSMLCFWVWLLLLPALCLLFVGVCTLTAAFMYNVASVVCRPCQMLVGCLPPTSMLLLLALHMILQPNLQQHGAATTALLCAGSSSRGCLLQTRLQHQVGNGDLSHGEVQALEDHLRRVQLQNTRLQDARDGVMQALHSNQAAPTAGNAVANPHSNSSSKLCSSFERRENSSV